MSEELWRHAGDETVTSHVRQSNVVIDYELQNVTLYQGHPDLVAFAQSSLMIVTTSSQLSIRVTEMCVF